MGEGPALPESFYMIPIRSLMPSTRHLLSVFLDPPAFTTTEEGLLPDASGLAELAGFDHMTIRFFQNKSSVTASLLENWNHGTLGNLFNYLTRLERFDCLTHLRDKIISDAEKWKSRKCKELPKNMCEREALTENTGEAHPLTADDVIQGHVQKYTACICCADNDLDLARSIEENLIRINIRIFIPQYHLLGGVHELESTAEVIEDRCGGRVIILISDSYGNSPACRFVTLFAKTLDPDSKRKQIIPVLRDNSVDYPRVLRGISTIKYNRCKSPQAFFEQICLSLGINQMVPASNSFPRKENSSDMEFDSIKTGLPVFLSNTSANLSNDLSNCREIPRTENSQTLNICCGIPNVNRTGENISQSEANNIDRLSGDCISQSKCSNIDCSSNDIKEASFDSAYGSHDFRSQLNIPDRQNTISRIFKSLKKTFRVLDKKDKNKKDSVIKSSNDLRTQELNNPKTIKGHDVIKTAEYCKESKTTTGTTSSTNHKGEPNDVTVPTQDVAVTHANSSPTSAILTCPRNISRSPKCFTNNVIPTAHANRDNDQDENLAFKI